MSNETWEYITYDDYDYEDPDILLMNKIELKEYLNKFNNENTLDKEKIIIKKEINENTFDNEELIKEIVKKNKFDL